MPGIQRIEVSVLRRGATLALYRICRTDTEILDAFISNYASDRPPRGVETDNVLLQMGLSTFGRRAQAEAVARRFPALGDHVALVVLRHGFGFAYAHTGARGQVTVWGRPLHFVAAAVETTRIRF